MSAIAASSTKKLRTQMTKGLSEGAKTKELIDQCLDKITKKPCKYGLKCYRRKGEHLEQFFHPDDDLYALSLWKYPDIGGEFLTLQQCMKFMDPFDKGIVDDAELLGALLQHLKGDDAPRGDDLVKIWDHIDDDGNGFVSFAEFIEWADEYGLGLPVGMEDHVSSSSRPSSGKQQGGLKCGYPDCRGGKDGGSCTDFKPRPGDQRICRCGHKRAVHTVHDSTADIQVPTYWRNASTERANWTGSEWVAVSDPQAISQFQNLMDASYKRAWTRDRGREPDGKQKRVPAGYQVVRVKRNENKKLWRKYHLKKRLIQTNIDGLGGEPEFKQYKVKTASVDLSAVIGSEAPDQSCNEWLLWHGTSLEGAEQICNEDFKQRYAGSVTGTLYGPGTYFAESCTKADEYAKETDVDGENLFTMLLCRVTGGLVKYTDEVEPEAQALTDAVLHDQYDSVIGDREACRQTFKEFVVFGSDQVYPEYIVHYSRRD